MDKRKIVALSTSVLMGSMFLVGCGADKKDKDTTNGDTTVVENVVDDVEPPAKKPNSEELKELDKAKEEELSALEEAESKEVKVGIWIPNVEYISTGDDSLDKLIRVEVVSVSEEEESDKYMRMLKTLNKCGDSPIQVVEFKSAKLNGNVLEIDMADATELGISSTTTEFLILEQVCMTMFEHFEEVQSIQFKVDGKIVESFLGHVDISQEFKR